MRTQNLRKKTTKLELINIYLFPEYDEAQDHFR